MALELKKNPVPIFIQLKSNKQLLFHDIKKNNKIIAATNNHFCLFSLYLYRAKSHTTRI